MLRLLLLTLTCLPLLGAEPFLVAHRGASDDAPENTLPAFQLAWKQGANAIEGDFRLTNDGHIVCVHDDTTKRTGDRNLTVAKSSLADLRKIDAGSWKDPRWKDTKIPTLKEVLATIPDHGSLYLEIKCGSEIVPNLVTQLEKSTIRKDQITVICFSSNVIRAFKEAAPDRTASWLCSFEHKAGKTKPTYNSAFATLAAIKADGLSTNAWKGIDKPFISRVRKAGCSHHVWTVNDASIARKFLDLGTATITTDRPGALRKELNP
jgi:glycerophosphoryl diester phosphodiesterase